MRNSFVPMVLILLVLSLFPCLAQKASRNKAVDGPEEARPDVSEMVAILPWIYEKGTPAAQRTAKEFLEAVLSKSHYFRQNSFEIIPESRVIQTWKQDLGHDPERQGNKLPPPRELLKLGQKLGVDWVITGHAVWHSRSIWAGLGPKTKSDCTVDMVVVDVKKKELSLDARQIKTGSTAREQPLRAGATALLGVVRAQYAFLLALPLTAASGGPKTPHEQRAAQLAIGKAIEPWIAIHPQNRKIDTGE